MGKPALVIREKDLNLPIQEWQCMLVDRDWCETDPTLLQILPYVILKTDANKVFMYQRGKGGNENRLHDKWSIGVGGHIDHLPGYKTNVDWFAEEACREVFEETTITVSQHRIATQLTEPLKLLRFTDSPVESVHLGIAIILTIPEQVVTEELGIVINGRFEEIESVIEMAVNGNSSVQFERWSQHVIENFLQ